MKHNTILACVCLALLLALFNPGLPLLDGSGNQNRGVWLAATDPMSVEEPKLVIGRDQSMPVFKAGEEGTLMIPVTNIKGGEARSVNVSLVIDKVEAFPFELGKMSIQTSMSSVGGYSTESAIFFGMKVAANAESNIYPIGVKIDYTSESGTDGQASGIVYVKITNENHAPLLKLVEVLVENEQIESGESRTVQLKIKNDGGRLARDIDLKLAGFTSNGLRLDQAVDTFSLKEFKGREFKFIPFKIYADPGMESGTYSLDLSMKYKDESNKEYNTESKVYITVVGTGQQGKNPKATPRLIIDDYSYGGVYAKAGEVFSLVISFLNTSREKDLNNIKVSLSSDENIFSPVKSSNSFFIEKISAGTSMQKVIQLRPKIDAGNKTYSITAEIEYEDSKGNKYTNKEMISVPVSQEISLTISDIVVPAECFAGAPVGISVDYYNTGRALIRNLTIRTEGDFQVKDGSIYVGNLEAGKSDYYDVTITPNQEGALVGKIMFDYDDDTGKHYQKKQAFEITAMKQVVPPVPEANPETMQNKDSKWKKPAIIGAGILALGVIGFIIRRRRINNNKEECFDE